jgi:hypothetical protein
MYEELEQQSRAECPACNGQLRLVTALAVSLSAFLCDLMAAPSPRRGAHILRTGRSVDLIRPNRPSESRPTLSTWLGQRGHDVVQTCW